MKRGRRGTPLRLSGLTVQTLVCVATAFVGAVFCDSAVAADVSHYNRDNRNVLWFLHASDIHVQNPENYGKSDYNANQFDRFLTTEGRYIDPKFTVITGDLTDAGYTGFFAQDREEWARYFQVVTNNGWNDPHKLLDIPGNHDRYQNPDWLYYKTGEPVYSVQGGRTNAFVQFHDNYDGGLGQYRIIAVNTNDANGAAWSMPNNCVLDGMNNRCVSDRPEISDGEYADLEARLKEPRSGHGMSLVFGHASIYTEPYTGFWQVDGIVARLAGLEITDTADSFRDLLNKYQVGAYGYGHTHRSGIKYDQVHGVNPVLINADSLSSGSYLIWALDNNIVTANEFNINQRWPRIVITSPTNKNIRAAYETDDRINPSFQAIPSFSLVNPIRALVFDVVPLSGVVEYSFDGVKWMSMNRVSGPLWEAEFDATQLPLGNLTLHVQYGGNEKWIYTRIEESPEGQIFPPDGVVVSPTNRGAKFSWSPPAENTASEVLGLIQA